VRKLSRELDKSIIIVVHDINMAARFCDEIVALHSGQVLTQGAVSDVFQESALKSIYGIEMPIADHTAGSAGTSLVGADEIVLSVGYTINLLRPGSGESLRCRSEVVRNGRRLIVTQSDVYARLKGNETHIARATVTLAVVPHEHVERHE